MGPHLRRDTGNLRTAHHHIVVLVADTVFLSLVVIISSATSISSIMATIAIANIMNVVIASTEVASITSTAMTAATSPGRHQLHFIQSINVK